MAERITVYLGAPTRGLHAENFCEIQDLVPGPVEGMSEVLPVGLNMARGARLILSLSDSHHSHLFESKLLGGDMSSECNQDKVQPLHGFLNSFFSFLFF